MVIVDALTESSCNNTCLFMTTHFLTMNKKIIKSFFVFFFMQRFPNCIGYFRFGFFFGHMVFFPPTKCTKNDISTVLKKCSLWFDKWLRIQSDHQKQKLIANTSICLNFPVLITSCSSIFRSDGHVTIRRKEGQNLGLGSVPTVLEQLRLIDWLIDWFDRVLRRIGNISAL